MHASRIQRNPARRASGKQKRYFSVSSVNLYYNFSWCGLGDSNSWPLPWQGSALTTELNPHAVPEIILAKSLDDCNTWWLLPDLNWGHKALQASALPTELKSHMGDCYRQLYYRLPALCKRDKMRARGCRITAIM